MSGPWDSFGGDKVSDKSLSDLVTQGSSPGPWQNYQGQAPAKAKFAEGQELAGTLEALLVGAARGASFGTVDEIGAGIRGAINVLKGGEYGPAYDAALKTARENIQKLQEAAPKTTIGGEIAGALGTAYATKGMLPAPAATLGAKAAQGAKIGATGGAAFGFGDSEGGLVNRLEGAAGGGALGGIAGAALPVLAAGAAPIINAGKALFRTTSPAERALSTIGKATGRDSVTNTDIPAAVAAGQSKGVPLAPVDLGPNLTRLGRTVETIPGEGSALATDFLSERQAGQGGRLVGQIQKAIASPDDFFKTLDELDLARKTTAKPLYEEAYTQPAWSESIASLMNRPSMLKAFRRAAAIAKEEGRDPKELGLDFDEAGDPKFLFGADKEGKIPTAQTMDYVKRGLDDVIEKFRNPVTGKLQLDESGRAINATRAQLLKELRAVNPKYGEALDAWGGPSHAMDVLDKARDFARGDVEISAKLFSAMSPADQELTRLGVARELKGMIDRGADEANKVKSIFGSPDKRAKLQLLFPDDASWNQFQAIMTAEKQIAKNAQTIGGGSVTGRIAAEQGDASNVLMEKFVTGGSRGAGMELVRRAFNGARGLDDKTSLEIAKRLFTNDPKVAGALARELAGQAVSRSHRATVTQQQLLNILNGINSQTAPQISNRPGDQSSAVPLTKTQMMAQALGGSQQPNAYAQALMGG